MRAHRAAGTPADLAPRQLWQAERLCRRRDLHAAQGLLCLPHGDGSGSPICPSPRHSILISAATGCQMLDAIGIDAETGCRRFVDRAASPGHCRPRHRPTTQDTRNRHAHSLCEHDRHRKCPPGNVTLSAGTVIASPPSPGAEPAPRDSRIAATAASCQLRTSPPVRAIRRRQRVDTGPACRNRL